MSNYTPAIGDHVRIVNRGNGWDGLTGVVIDIDQDGRRPLYRIQADEGVVTPDEDTSVDRLGWWYAEHLQSTKGERPVAALRHDTSKVYADRADSRLLDPEHRDLLIAASEGKEVDVFEFRKAATAALSLASTRAGQSPLRRQYAKEARHLIHWADAILENHLKGLPAYGPGERSPKIARLEKEVAEEKAARQEAQERLSEWDDALVDAQARASEAESRASKLEAATTIAERIIRDTSAALAQSVRETDRVKGDRDTVGIVLDYALGLLCDHDKARVFGYWDAKVES